MVLRRCVVMAKGLRQVTGSRYSPKAPSGMGTAQAAEVARREMSPQLASQGKRWPTSLVTHAEQEENQQQTIDKISTGVVTEDSLHHLYNLSGMVYNS